MVSQSGTVKKVISESSAIVEFSAVEQPLETVVGSGNFTRGARHEQSVLVEGITSKSAIMDSLELKVHTTIRFPRIMEVFKTDSGEAALRPWSPPTTSQGDKPPSSAKSKPNSSPDSKQKASE